jgi:hypothetical protein
LKQAPVPFARTVKWTANNKKIWIVESPLFSHCTPLVCPQGSSERDDVANTRASSTIHHIWTTCAPDRVQILSVPPHVALIRDEAVLPRKRSALHLPLSWWILCSAKGVVDCPAAGEHHLLARFIHCIRPSSIWSQGTVHNYGTARSKCQRKHMRCLSVRCVCWGWWVNRDTHIGCPTTHFQWQELHHNCRVWQSLHPTT